MGQVLRGTQEDHAQRSAAGMIAVFGSEAEKICRTQIDKMRRRKDAAGQRVWENVLAHIRGPARPAEASPMEPARAAREAGDNALG